VDICYEGVWSNVVNVVGFGVNEATVACIQLGLISNGERDLINNPPRAVYNQYCE